MEENKIFIPGRLKNAAVGGHVAGTEDIYDDGLSKTQQEINAQHEAALNAPSTGVIARLETLEGEVAFSGDFEAENNPSGIVSGGEKITTTNAVNGALDYAGYFECSSNADAVTKAVLNTGYALRNGGCIKIKMTNANTADNVKLQLGNADAKDLYYNDEIVSSGNSWEAGEVVEVYYNGTAFYANNVAGGSGDGAFDISKYKAVNNTPATYRTLADALGTNGANVPQNKRKGGMTVKYIQLTEATYSIVKTEGLETQPTGTELQEAISVADGTYTAAQLPQNITLPQNIGTSTTYYLAVTETVDEQEVTTYTMWVVTKLTNDITEYVQWVLKNTTWSIVQSDWIGKDETPTKGSINLVTSGGVYDEVFIEETAIDDWTNASISYNYTNRISLVVTNQNTLTYNAVSNGGRAFIYFPVALKNGETYHISFDYTHSTNSNTYISFASAVSGDTIKSILLQGTSGSINCEYVHESAIKGFNIYSTQVVTGKELVLKNVRIYQVRSVKSDVEENKRTISEWKEISIDVIDDFSDASVSTTASTMIIENNNGVFTITATSIGKRAFILFPNGLVDGNEYKLSFDYINSGGNIIHCNFASHVAEASQGAFSFGGAEGKAIGFFTKTSSIRGVYFPTTDIGAGNTLTIENMKIQIENDAKWHIENLYKKDTSNKANLEQLNIENEYLPFKLNEYKSGVTWCSYDGQSINPQNRIGYELFENYGASQACAIYGETMFVLRDKGGTFGWINLRTKGGRKANNAWASDCPFLPSAVTGVHCNSAQFSEVFYDENDEFPLLYISGSEREQATKFFVARVVRYKDKYTYHLELVQTVTMPPSCTYANIGVEGNYLYMQRNFGTDSCSIFKCEIPAIFDGNGDVINTVVMSDEDIVRTYTNAPVPANPQGVCVHKGVLYSSWGGTSGTNSYLTAYDLFRGETINTVSLSQLGLTFEPEGIGFYKETMFIKFGSPIYRIWI